MLKGVDMLNLTDHFLVAMPSLDDEIFKESVVYITSYTEANGSIGVIVNKPLDKKLNNAFKNLDFSSYNPNWPDKPLYLGGPTNANNGFVLHRTDNSACDETLFQLTNDRSVLSEIANSADKNNLFVSIGYSSWSQQQLEREIINNDWLVVKANPELIYDVKPSERYAEALKMLGVSNLSYLYANEVIFA